jgi:hypothetical protein
MRGGQAIWWGYLGKGQEAKPGPVDRSLYSSRLPFEYMSIEFSMNFREPEEN